MIFSGRKPEDSNRKQRQKTSVTNRQAQDKVSLLKSHGPFVAKINRQLCLPA
jgi:hypothetical protein